MQRVSVANRETAAIRSMHRSMNSRAASVANRETAAIRSYSVVAEQVLQKCSKSRDGRNPQLGALSGDDPVECSKSRDGRNPQRPLSDTFIPAKCSKSRDGRNPQRQAVSHIRDHQV